MSDDTVPVFRIEATGHTETNDLKTFIDRLEYPDHFELEYFPDPDDEEPDFYLLRERDSE